ncbi:MAG: DUF4153 domain-containing protein, partial [Prevotellaceae bacterium]|nr:DUF4153 domain-containing protein [Prevotellaceae bacterium]
TEERYYVWLLALWLLGASLYMIFLRGKSLRPLIVSLAAVGVLSVCGWWSASEVSNRSQLAQFLRLVDDNNLLSDGKITQEIQLKNNEAGNETGKQLSSIMRYFGDKKRLDVLQPYFSANIDSIWLSKGSYSWEKAMVQYNDFEEEMIEQRQPGKVRLVASMELDALDVSGYARLYSCESGHTPMDSVENGITYDHRTQKILVYRNNKLEKSIDMLAAIASLNLVDTAIDVRYFLPQSKLSVVVDDSTKVVFKRIDCTFFNLDKHGAFDEPDDVQIKDIDAFILMK